MADMPKVIVCFKNEISANVFSEYTMVLMLLSFLLTFENLVFGNYFSLNNTFFDSKYELKRVNDGPTPIYFDWRDINMVSPIKDQGKCNACWALRKVANIKSHIIKIHYGREETLSKHFLIDCDGGRVGCESQSILETYGRIVSKLGGVLRGDDCDPYRGRLGTCKWDGRPQPVPVTDFRRVPPYAAAIKDYI